MSVKNRNNEVPENIIFMPENLRGMGTNYLFVGFWFVRTLIVILLYFVVQSGFEYMVFSHVQKVVFFHQLPQRISTRLLPIDRVEGNLSNGNNLVKIRWENWWKNDFLKIEKI